MPVVPRPPRSGRRSRQVVAGLALVVGLTGCSGMSGDTSTQAGSGTPAPSGAAAADPTALREELAAQYAGDRPTASDREEAGCFADALLERRDAEALARVGLVGADGHLVEPFPTLDVDTAGAWVDAQEECTDFVSASADAFAAQTRGRLDRTTYAVCLARRIAPDRVREALVQSLSGGLDSPAVAELTRAQSTCVTEALPPD